MKTMLLRASALSFALLTTTALPAPATAQNPPAHRNLDANGVDLTHGDHVFAFTEAAIGSGGNALALVRLRGGRQAHSSWDAITFQRSVSGSSVSVVIGRGAHWESFTGTLASLVADRANGATLVRAGDDYHYRSADGTMISFGDPTESYAGGETNFCAETTPVQASCVLVPLSITEPNGASVTFEWTVHSIASGANMPQDHFHHYRLAGVANSAGYAAAFDYVQDSAAFNATPPADWFERTGAALLNTAVSTSVPAGVGYTEISPGVVDVTDAAGRIWRITGGAGITGLRRPGDSADSFAVGYSGGSLSSVTRDGVTTSYSRSVSGSTATMTVTDAASQATVIVSDLDVGRPTSITDPLNRQTSFQYDSDGRPTRITRPEGNYVRYTYDGRGNVTETRSVAKSGSGLADIVTSASYDAACSNPVTCNAPNSVTDARGNVTDYTYDSTHGGVLSVTAPAPATGAARPQTRYSYTLADGEHRLTGISACSSGTAPACLGTAAETRTRIGYDGHGQVVSVERGDGTGALLAATAAAYTDMGDVATIDGPLSGTADTVRFRYNGGRQLVGAISPDPDGGGALDHRAQRIGYNPAGLRSKVETGTVDSQSDADWAAFASLEEVRQNYDSNNRPNAQRLVSGSTTYALAQTSYDALGRVQCTAQRMNPAEFASLPSDACTLDTEGSYGPDRIARTTYDHAGQVTRVETGYGVPGVAADELATTWSDNGGVVTVTDAEGNRTTYEYDGHDRMVKTRMPSANVPGTSSTTDYEQLTLDANGNVTTRRLRDAQSIAYVYDALNRLIGKDVTGANYAEFDTTYGYDNLSRLTSATAPHGDVASFAYDALGRTVSETSAYGTKAMTYDAAGRMTRLTWPDSFYVDYVYNVAGDMTEIRENGAASGPGRLALFAYDDRGRRTSLTRGNGTVTTWAYDNVSRLTELAHNLAGTSSDLTLGFSHNPAGQIASNTRSNDAYSFTGHVNMSRADTVNGLNQVTATGAAAVVHDARGNIESIASSGYYVHTAENRLAWGWDPDPTTLAYEPLGRLTQTTYPGTTRFDHLGDAMITEFDWAAGVTRRYVPGPGMDEPIAWYEGTGTSDRRWFHADERGSVIAVSDGGGNLVGAAPNRYDEYGVPQGGTLTGRFGYTGQQWLPELGMYYYRARIYSPTLGRFMQTDPIGYGSGMNLYAYVLNDPVNLTDPMGLQTGDDDDEDDDEIVVFGFGLGRTLSGGISSGTVGWPTFSEYNGLITGSEVNCGSDVCVPLVVLASGQIGHNGPPLSPTEQLLGWIRRAPLLIIACILACKGPEVQQQLDVSEAIQDMIGRSVDQSRQGARHRDYRTNGSRVEDFRRVQAACGCVSTIHPGGAASFNFMGRAYSTYISSQGVPTISIYEMGGSIVAKFRY